MTGIVLWLPNIDLVAAIFAHNDVNFWQKISSMLGLYQLVFDFFGAIQLVLVMLFSTLSLLSSGLVFYVLFANNCRELSPKVINPSLLFSVGSAGIYMAGLVILVPVVTVSGLVFGYNLHGIGTALAIVGALGLTMSVFSLMRIVSSLEH